MTLPQWIVVAIALLHGLELVHAHRNARRLIAEGGRAYGDGHYPVIVGLHVVWLIALGWVGGRIAEPDWLLFAFWVLLEAARLWVVATLGRFWTTRVISVPDAPLVRRGPFRWLRHCWWWSRRRRAAAAQNSPNQYTGPFCTSQRLVHRVLTSSHAHRWC